MGALLRFVDLTSRPIVCAHCFVSGIVSSELATKADERMLEFRS
jgi:hypothetical protein